ncbi:uncharacterized protein TNCV_3425991 [Trichonephila clavipes]|nr:uncharacterized protein TNCV_3425991 [Trichonephila clavipes]
MGDITYAENSDMHYLYDRPNNNGQATLRMYQAQFPDILQRLQRQLRKQRVKAVNPADYPLHQNFCLGVVQQRDLRSDFIAYVLFTDEVTFTHGDFFLRHNSNVGNQEIHIAYQQRFCANVWVEQMLPELLQDVLIVIHNRRRFRYDEAPAHFSTDVRIYLNATFEAQRIGRGGLIPWPPKSPDLSSHDFGWGGHPKNLVYVTPLDSNEDFVARIFEVVAHVLNYQAALNLYPIALTTLSITLFKSSGSLHTWSTAVKMSKTPFFSTLIDSTKRIMWKNYALQKRP